MEDEMRTDNQTGIWNDIIEIYTKLNAEIMNGHCKWVVIGKSYRKSFAILATK